MFEGSFQTLRKRGQIPAGQNEAEGRNHGGPARPVYLRGFPLWRSVCRSGALRRRQRQSDRHEENLNSTCGPLPPTHTQMKTRTSPLPDDRCLETPHHAALTLLNQFSHPSAAVALISAFLFVFYVLVLVKSTGSYIKCMKCAAQIRRVLIVITICSSLRSSCIFQPVFKLAIRHVFSPSLGSKNADCTA